MSCHQYAEVWTWPDIRAKTVRRYDLYWLDITDCIEYWLCVNVCKWLHGLAPQYSSDAGRDTMTSTSLCYRGQLDSRICLGSGRQPVDDVRSPALHRLYVELQDALEDSLTSFQKTFLLKLTGYQHIDNVRGRSITARCTKFHFSYFFSFQPNWKTVQCHSRTR